MSDFKKFETIENTDQLGVVSLAIRPNQASKFGEGNLSGKDLQRRFDRLANTIVKNYNELVRILGNAFDKDANGNHLSTALQYIAWRVKKNDISGDEETESLAEFMKYLEDGTLADELLIVEDPTDTSEDPASKLKALSTVLTNIHSAITIAVSDINDSLDALEKFTGYDETSKDTIPALYYEKAKQELWKKDLDKALEDLNAAVETLETFVGYEEQTTLVDALDDTFVSETDLETKNFAAKTDLDSYALKTALKDYLKNEDFDSFKSKDGETVKYGTLAEAVADAITRAGNNAKGTYISRKGDFESIEDIIKESVDQVEAKGYQTASDVETAISNATYGKDHIDGEFEKYALKSDVTGLYSLQGTRVELPKSGVEVGYVYDISSETTYNGKTYPAGTNFACIAKNDDGSYVWDPMTQNFDTSSFVQKTNIVDSLSNDATDMPLSANQGKILNASKVSKPSSQSQGFRAAVVSPNSTSVSYKDMTPEGSANTVAMRDENGDMYNSFGRLLSDGDITGATFYYRNYEATFNSDTLVAEISKLSKLSDSVVTFPISINNGGTDYKISSLSLRLFSGNLDDRNPSGDAEIISFCRESLEKVVLPAKLETINHNCFNTCSVLRSVIFPSTLKLIGAAAFYGCGQLEKIDLPSSLTTIKNQAFDNCTSLKKVFIPKTVTTMSYNVFQRCNPDLMIYCEASEKPSGWDDAWCKASSSSYNIPKEVFWGVTRADYDKILELEKNPIDPSAYELARRDENGNLLSPDKDEHDENYLPYISEKTLNQYLKLISPTLQEIERIGSEMKLITDILGTGTVPQIYDPKLSIRSNFEDNQILISDEPVKITYKLNFTQGRYSHDEGKTSVKMGTYPIKVLITEKVRVVDSDGNEEVQETIREVSAPDAETAKALSSLKNYTVTEVPEGYRIKDNKSSEEQIVTFDSKHSTTEIYKNSDETLILLITKNGETITEVSVIPCCDLSKEYETPKIYVNKLAPEVIGEFSGYAEISATVTYSKNYLSALSSFKIPTDQSIPSGGVSCSGSSFVGVQPMFIGMIPHKDIETTNNTVVYDGMQDKSIIDWGATASARIDSLSSGYPLRSYEVELNNVNSINCYAMVGIIPKEFIDHGYRLTYKQKFNGYYTTSNIINPVMSAFENGEVRYDYTLNGRTYYICPFISTSSSGFGTADSTYKLILSK